MEDNIFKKFYFDHLETIYNKFRRSYSDLISQPREISIYTSPWKFGNLYKNYHLIDIILILSFEIARKFDMRRYDWEQMNA